MQSNMDVTLLALTFFLSIIWEIQEGIIVSVILSLLLVVKRSSKARISLVVSMLFESFYGGALLI
jgi:MFS superfamily sulfate permease-like transporter